MYLRTEASVNSRNYQENKELLTILSQEKLELEAKGFDIGFLGDYNSRIKVSSRFQFVNYPHNVNNNGRLLMDFAAENQLYCLNPLKWRGRQEELYTYQRNMGSAGYHKSILDLGLATSTFVSGVVDFKVSNEESVSVDSDHSTLILSYFSSEMPSVTQPKTINIYKKITNWVAYKAVLEKRVAGSFSWFEGQTVHKQNDWFINQMKAVGRTVMPRIKVGRGRRQKPKSTKKARKVKKLRKALRDAVNKNAKKEEIAVLEASWKSARDGKWREDMLHSLKKKYKIRNLIAAKGKDGSKLFWKCINGNKKPSTTIEALDSGKGLVFDAQGKADVITKHIKGKYRTSDVPKEDIRDPPRDENLGTPTKMLSDEESSSVVREISKKELDWALDTLDEQKAEGLDGVTNGMLKHTGPLARSLILELLNDVLLSGLNPSAWKIGKVILLLKRPPDIDISNYRPITLISAISKLLTKIMAQRISEVVESSGIAGDLQNGFRKGQNCSENIFILNALLELNRSKKRLSYLMFVDLQALDLTRSPFPSFFPFFPLYTPPLFFHPLI